MNVKNDQDGIKDTTLIQVEEALSILGILNTGNEIESYEQLSGGLTNDNIVIHLKRPLSHIDHQNEKFTTNSHSMVLRRFRKGTSIHLGYNRRREYINAKIAAIAGIAPTVVGIIEANQDREKGHGGALALCFIDGLTLKEDDLVQFCNSNSKVDLLTSTLRAMHRVEPFANIFDPFRARKRYEEEIVSMTGRAILWQGYESIVTMSKRLEERLSSLEEILVPCHNDLLAANFIKRSGLGHDELTLIDFELSGMAPASWELGNIVSENGLDGNEDAIERLTLHYWQTEKTVQGKSDWLQSRICRVKAWSIISKITWSAWGAVLYHLNQKTQQSIEQPFDYKEWSMERIKKANSALQDERMIHTLLEGLNKDVLDNV